MPSPPTRPDHINLLQKELTNLERQLGKLYNNVAEATRQRRAHVTYYGDLVKKVHSLNQYKRKFQEMMYSAVMADNQRLLDKAQVGLDKATLDQHAVQLKASGCFRGLVMAVKRENEYKDAIRQLQDKVALRQEEMHRLRPCEVFLCSHCRVKRDRRERQEQFGVLVDRVMDRLRRVRI